MNNTMEVKFAKSAFLNFLLWGICSSLGTTVSTTVDAVLVGNFVGSDGLAVVNIATPVFLTYSLLGVTIGIGANVLIGRHLGASKVEEANQIFNAQVFWGILTSVFFLVLSLSFKDELLHFLGARDALLPLANNYLTVVFFSAPLFTLYHILDLSVRTDGDPRLAAIASSVVIITNLSLDLLFMKGLGWGIVGASVSLCIAEALGSGVLLLHFVKKHALLAFGVSIPRLKDIKSFVINGFGVGSAFIFQAVIILTFNTLLLDGSAQHGVLYVAIYGIIYTISMLPFAVFDGASNAISTVVSIFAGEKDSKSMMTVLWQSIKIVSISGTLITLLPVFCTEPFVRFFGLSGTTQLTIAVLAIRIFSVSIIFTGINTVVTSFWQAIGRARLASIFSVARNFILMLALGFALISNYQIIGLSITYVCCEVICLVLIILVLIFRSSKEYIGEKYALTDRVYEQYYIIQAESIAQISTDLEQLCDNWEIPPKQSFFINLMVEEVLLNIIKFGLKDTSQKHYIAIKLFYNNGDYIVRIRDDVSTYNPFDSNGDEIDHAVIKMITEKTKYCNYQRKLIFNYLYLII